MTARSRHQVKTADGPAIDPLTAAVDLHRAGDMEAAEKIYRQILTRTHDHADALHLLGVLETQRGRPGDAVGHIEHAIALTPNAPHYHTSLGVALRALGRRADAAAAYRRAIALDAKSADAQANLGNVLAEIGDIDGAIDAYQHARALNPVASKAHRNLAGLYDRQGIELQRAGRLHEAIERHRAAIDACAQHSDAHHNLGVALQATGHLTEAAEAFRAAIAIDPKAAESHCNLGQVLTEIGDYAAAESALRQALALDPQSTEAQNGLGVLLESSGEAKAAIATFDDALAADPQNIQVHYNRAHALLKAGEAAKALLGFDAVIAIEPSLAKAHSNRGAALESLLRFEDAAVAYDTALSLKPELAEARNNLAGVYLIQGRHDEAERAFREALDHALAARSPLAPALHSNLLFAMSYNDAHDVAALSAEHDRWRSLHGTPVEDTAPAFRNAADPDRRLRIGYVSADFHTHAVAFFVMPILRKHDRTRVEIHCYADVKNPDELTEQFRTATDVWHDTAALSHAELAALIRADGIDILVDLGGHTSGNRQRMFALKPAPVQVSYLGDTMTTGLAVMDYKMTDAHITPPDTKEGFTETLATLPDCFACYSPPPETPEVGPLPALSAGQVTFGCFNNLAKVTPSVIALWSATLHAVPGSRLILKTKALNDASTRKRLGEQFAAHGIDGERLVLRGHVAGIGGHLAMYNEVDIALDTFPYAGGTTTIEALWMGVPVISLVGDRSTARMGLSFLTAAGLGAMATPDPAGFVLRAQELAGDLHRLAEIRSKLRHRIAVSPLCDAVRFVQNVEDLYRAMWRRWCGTQPGAAPRHPQGANA